MRPDPDMLQGVFDVVPLREHLDHAIVPIGNDTPLAGLLNKPDPAGVVKHLDDITCRHPLPKFTIKRRAFFGGVHTMCVRRLPIKNQVVTPVSDVNPLVHVVHVRVRVPLAEPENWIRNPVQRNPCGVV